MFILDGKPLSPDAPFTGTDGTRYPANWLRLATPEQKAEIGITEAPDPLVWDQRYFWGYDADGNLIPKQLEDEIITPEEGEPYTQTGLKTQHIRQTKETANTLLAPTDWYIVRKFERDVDVPVGITSYRSAVISVAEEREALIESVTSVEELKGLYESPNVMPNWPTI